MSVPRMPVQFKKAPRHHHACKFFGKGPSKGCWHCEQLNNSKPYTGAVADDLK